MSDEMNQKLFITFISIILFSNIVLAIPSIPHQFYGSVTINENPAPDGTIVSASIDGKEVASTTTSGGRYGYSPVFYIDDPNNNRAGKIINFFVNGIDTGQTAIFSNGKSTELNLSITMQPSPGPSPTTPSPSPTPSGPPPSGLTPIVPPSETRSIASPTSSVECVELWKCTDWGPCVDRLQHRVCTDKNNCGTTEDKPFETQPCSTVTIEETEQPPTFSFTGMITAIIGNPAYVISFVAGAAAVIGFLFYNKTYKKIKKFKKK